MINKKDQDIEITYVFSNSKRSSMIKNKEYYSEEFFYGYFSMKDRYKTNLIEFSDKNNNFFLFDKLIMKFTNMPIFFSFVINFKKYKVYKNTSTKYKKI